MPNNSDGFADLKTTQGHLMTTQDEVIKGMQNCDLFEIMLVQCLQKNIQFILINAQ